MGAEVGQGLAVLVGDHRVTPADTVIARVFNVADGRDGAGDEVRWRFGVAVGGWGGWSPGAVGDRWGWPAGRTPGPPPHPGFGTGRSGRVPRQAGMELR